MAEYAAVNRGVVGSSPTPGASSSSVKEPRIDLMGLVDSWRPHQFLDELRRLGSSIVAGDPVGKLARPSADRRLAEHLFHRMAQWPR